MTSEYLRQRIWSAKQQCDKLEREIGEKSSELEKLRTLSAQIRNSESSFLETCARYSATAQRMSALDHSPRAQSGYVQSLKGFLSGQDYRHAQDCFRIMKSRGVKMEEKSEHELWRKKQELAHAKAELSNLYKQLEAAISQENAQGTA